MSVRARGGGFDSRSAILYLSPLWRRDAMCGLLRCSETGSTAEEAALNRRGSVRVLGQAFGTFEHRGGLLAEPKIRAA